MPLFLGIDVGTTATKALALDTERGTVVASASASYGMETPAPGWAEQDAEDYVEAALATLRELSARLGARVREVRGIGLSGQMHSAVLLDGDRALVREAILWCDGRTSAECRAIEDAVGRDGLARMVGNAALEGFTLPKLLWLREHEPSTFAHVAHVVMPKDYVAMHLTGRLVTDVSDASGTLAFDPGARTVSTEILQALGVDPAIFPSAGESSAPIATITAAIAEETGLPADTLVVHGAADNAAAAVGLGVVKAGRAMVSLGTSGVVLAHADEYAVDPSLSLHSFAHAVPGRYYQMGVMLSAGGALRWYRDTLCDGETLAAELRGADAYDIILEAAQTSHEGAGGVVFLPYLMGERTPHADADARAALVGMSASSTKADVSRAVVEGITFGLADSLDLIERLGAIDAGTELRLSGGGAKSPLWRQLMADVFGLEVVTTTSTEGPAFGAALLAAVGAGAFESVEQAADAMVHVIARSRPDPVAHARYAEVRSIYRGLYPALSDAMHRLARLR